MNLSASTGARHALLIAILGSTPALLSAQRGTGVVAGRVVSREDTARMVPLRGAAVRVAGATVGAATGADGSFVLRAVPAGAIVLHVRLLGYANAERTLQLADGDTLRVVIALEREAQLLDPVRADATPADLIRFQTRPHVATTLLDASAMAGVPRVGEPDVVRVTQLLPGVVARNDFNTGLNVRGGEADQNLILLDGHPIYNPFHLGGLFSTFMDATVGGVELMSAAFPASFGGRLSSVLDVRSAEESQQGLHGVLDLSALGTSAKLGGLFHAGRGSWSLAGRRTYADAVTALFTDNIFPYHFRDLHGRATYALPNDMRLAVTVYGGRDVLDANLAEFESDSMPSRASQGTWAFNWGNRVVGASLSKRLDGDARLPLLGWRLGDSTTLEQRLSTSGFSTTLDLGDGAMTRRSGIRDIRVAGSVVAQASARQHGIGYDIASHRVHYAAGSAETGTAAFDLVQRPVSASAWIDELWRVSPRWILQGGLRAEGLTGRDWMALSPRVAVKYFATPTFALTGAAGRVTQWMHSLAGDGPLRYFEVWIASDSFIPVATAWHFVLGAQRRVRDHGLLQVEGYLKDYDRVLDANWSEDPQRRGDEFIPVQGRSYGLDLLVRWQPASGVAGWVSYSYGVSERWRGQARWAPGHDRRHDVDLVATWRVRKYRLGGRFGLATGTPYTPIVGEIARRVYDPSRDRWGTGDPRIFVESLGGARHGARFPATHRLDLDASRDFRVRGALVSPYLSVVNAYNAPNVFVYLYNYSTAAPTRRALSQFPVLPSLGVRIAF